MADSAERFWAVVPAAGIGRRMGCGVPKQYLTVQGRTIIEHTLAPLCAEARIAGVVVAVAAADRWWPEIAPAFTAVRTVAGGRERCHSVLNALAALAAEDAAGRDWVLVHDAVRPCLRRADLERLIEAAAGHPVGGVLGVPARDTLKSADAHGQVRATLDRSTIWHAFTPQMFRLAPLRDAIEAALARGVEVTDEAQAMELAGAPPRMVEGHGDNIKITRSEDLAAAAMFFSEAGRAGCA